MDQDKTYFEHFFFTILNQKNKEKDQILELLLLVDFRLIRISIIQITFILNRILGQFSHSFFFQNNDDDDEKYNKQQTINKDIEGRRNRRNMENDPILF